jgi:heme exporter protein A
MVTAVGEGRQSATPLIVVSQLSKRFGSTWALKGVNLSVMSGERVLLVGPNGAGKSTLLRVVATLLRPTSGHVRLFGLDAFRHRDAVRPRLSLLGHIPYLVEELTVKENLEMYSVLYGRPGRAEEVLALLELDSLAGRRVSGLSRGQVQRVGLARALINDPELLLLDEPETGLDQISFGALSKILAADSQRTVLLSTHQWERYQGIVGRAVVMEGGRVVGDVPAQEMQGLLPAGRG